MLMFSVLPKVMVIDNLIDKSDNIIICGGMAYTFLKTCFGECTLMKIESISHLLNKL